MLRSAAKPLQALPAVRDGVVERYDLAARHVAVACGSHEGTPAHAAAVAELIARAGLSLADLRPRGVHPPLARRRRPRAGAGRPDATRARAQLLGQPRPDAAAREHARARPRRLPRPGRAGAGRRHGGRRAGVRCEPVIAGDRCGMRAYSVPFRNAALGYLRLAGDGMPEPYARGRAGRRGRDARGARDGRRARFVHSLAILAAVVQVLAHVVHVHHQLASALGRRAAPAPRSTGRRPRSRSAASRPPAPVPLLRRPHRAHQTAVGDWHRPPAADGSGSTRSFQSRGAGGLADSRLYSRFSRISRQPPVVLTSPRQC